jgi:H+-translocating NAD(P) transhydrogenase subunit alpha
MSGTNAISGITLIGALISTKLDSSDSGYCFRRCFHCAGHINVVGGFVVTNRMLHMFRKKD